MTDGLDALFAPRTVAIVGASPERHYSRSVIANLRQHGYPDERIFPVNPRYDDVDALPCYSSVDALPSAPDGVIVLVGRNAVAGVIDQAVTGGARAALVIADGYAEESADGLAAQHALGRAARDAGLAMLGPNTLGYVVPATGTGMWCAGALPHPLQPGGIVVLAQSSGMLNLLMAVAGQRAIGIRACVSVGNAEVLGLPDLVKHFVADPECTTLGLVVESIDRPRELMDALALARAAGKPVVVLKIGVSELGRRNSVAHTGRLAGPEQGWTALFDRLDVCAARDLDDFVETLTLFGGLGPLVAGQAPTGRELGVAFATISGGETSLVCDIAEQEGLRFADLDAGTLDLLRGRLGKTSMIGNPLDLQNTRTSRPDVFWACLQALVGDANVDVLSVRLNLNATPTDQLRTLYRDVVVLARDAGVQPVVLTRAYEYLDLAWWSFFSELDVPFVLSYRNTMHAFAQFNRWLIRRADPYEPPAAVPLIAGETDGVITLDPDETAQWLRDAGVDYVASATVCEPAAAAVAAATIGFPVVLKAVSPGLVHKSEAGGVALDLNSADAVEAAARTMREQVAKAIGREPADVGFEVQRMVPDGVELIVGMDADPTWGPVLMVGSGGIYAETIRDVVWELPPVSPTRARAMLERLRTWALLDGARGREPADVDCVVDLLVTFGDAVARSAQPLAGVDLNPVVVGAKGRGTVAVDASVFVRAPSETSSNEGSTDD